MSGRRPHLNGMSSSGCVLVCVHMFAVAHRDLVLPQLVAKDTSLTIFFFLCLIPVFATSLFPRFFFMSHSRGHHSIDPRHPENK